MWKLKNLMPKPIKMATVNKVIINLVMAWAITKFTGWIGVAWILRKAPLALKDTKAKATAKIPDCIIIMPNIPGKIKSKYPRSLVCTPEEVTVKVWGILETWLFKPSVIWVMIKFAICPLPGLD